MLYTRTLFGVIVVDDVADDPAICEIVFVTAKDATVGLLAVQPEHVPELVVTEFEIDATPLRELAAVTVNVTVLVTPPATVTDLVHVDPAV